MSYRPQIKKSDGTMQDLPLDAETVQGQEPGALAFKNSITNTDIAVNAAIAQSKINGLVDELSGMQEQIDALINAGTPIVDLGTLTPVSAGPPYTSFTGNVSTEDYAKLNAGVIVKANVLESDYYGILAKIADDFSTTLISGATFSISIITLTIPATRTIDGRAYSISLYNAESAAANSSNGKVKVKGDEQTYDMYVDIPSPQTADVGKVLTASAAGQFEFSEIEAGYNRATIVSVSESISGGTIANYNTTYADLKNNPQNFIIKRGDYYYIFAFQDTTHFYFINIYKDSTNSPIFNIPRNYDILTTNRIDVRKTDGYWNSSSVDNQTKIYECDYVVEMGGDYFDLSIITTIETILSTTVGQEEQSGTLQGFVTRLFYDGMYASYDGGNYTINNFCKVAPFTSQSMQEDCQTVGICVYRDENNRWNLAPVFADPNDYITGYGTGYYKINPAYVFNVANEEATVVYFCKRNIDTVARRELLVFN